MAKNKEELEGRLTRLEGEKPEAESKPGDSSLKSKPEDLRDLREQETKVEVIAGRERALTKTFGRNPTADTLMEFLDHYQLCVDINLQKRIPGWERSDYRAKELRCQLEGEAATYVRQEEAMQEDWVHDDEEIIRHLQDRWMNRDCIELDIIEFEEARQREDETLAQFMTRLKGLGQRAFSEFDPQGMQQRIIWRFLDGVRDRDVRSSIIRERWMKDRRTPKSYDEVLKIGETALMVKVAARATGALGTDHKASGTTNKNLVASMRQGPTRKMKGGSGSGSSRGGSQSPKTPRALECFYCGEHHPGGWRFCEKRKKENPRWLPSHKTNSGYSSTPSSNPSPVGSNASSNQSF